MINFNFRKNKPNARRTQIAGYNDKKGRKQDRQL
jgi:hypothetical protein